jgi:hypothetical protein
LRPLATTLFPALGAFTLYASWCGPPTGWQDAEMTTERIEIERLIPADAAAIFRY